MAKLTLRRYGVTFTRYLVTLRNGVLTTHTELVDHLYHLQGLGGVTPAILTATPPIIAGPKVLLRILKERAIPRPIKGKETKANKVIASGKARISPLHTAPNKQRQHYTMNHLLRALQMNGGKEKISDHHALK
jgi:hypothetical protein